MRRILRAVPTMLRIGFAEAIAYRAEFIIWMLTTTMPLVMLALWTAVARDGQFGRFGQSDFVAYYLAVLIVRTLTSSWVVWEMNQEVRMGTLSMRLLRPMPPFVSWMCAHLAAIPLRGLVALPIAIILLFSSGVDHVTRDPVILALVPVLIVSAWLITFCAMFAIGCLSMMIERSQAVWEIWMGLWAVLSGYLVPLELLPGSLQSVARWLPFRYMLAVPVEALTNKATRPEVLAGLATQWGMIAFFGTLAVLLWRQGIKRFEAFGA